MLAVSFHTKKKKNQGDRNIKIILLKAKLLWKCEGNLKNELFLYFLHSFQAVFCSVTVTSIRPIAKFTYFFCAILKFVLFFKWEQYAQDYK